MLQLFQRLFLASGMLVGGSLSAQSLEPTVIASDGEFYTSSQGSISWTLGEVITETVTSSANILTQGFQQPKKLNVSVLNIMPTGAWVFVYPNPTRGNLYVDLSKLQLGDYQIELVDALGQRVHKGIAGATAQPYLLSVADLATGIYLLNVTSDNFHQSFKIINNQ